MSNGSGPIIIHSLALSPEGITAEQKKELLAIERRANASHDHKCTHRDRLKAAMIFYDAIG